MEGKWRRRVEEVQIQAAIWLAFLLPPCRWWPQQPQACTTINWGYMGGRSVEILGYLLSFWPSQRLLNFWIYTTFPTVGYVGRGCLRYWSFVGSWRGNLLTIYKLGNGRGGVSSCHTTFIGWWLHQGTRGDIITRDEFALQNMPIGSTAAVLNAEKYKDLLRMHHSILDMKWL